MKKKIYLLSWTIIFAVLLIAMLVPNVEAVPPVSEVQQFSLGYVIIDSPQEFIKINQNFTYNFFVYNISDGLPISNDTGVNCSLHLSNSSGDALFNADAINIHNAHWQVKIDKSYFSEVGEYDFGTECQSAFYGGVTASYYQVTIDGLEPRPVDYIAIMIGMIGVCILIFVLSHLMKPKALKILFLFVGLIMMLFIISLANLMVAGGSGAISLANIKENIGIPFTILMWTTIVTFFYFVVTYIMDTTRELETKKRIERGDEE